MERVIMHVDLDAFFAACEEARNSGLKGKPVVIGANPRGGQGRGVVSTANYEARKYGIKSAMPISWAYKRCKNAIYLPVDFKLYREISDRIFGGVKELGEKFERAGIDEAYVDLSSGSFENAVKIANKIKIEIVGIEKISCGIGIGPNKLIAKIGSDFRKPDGLTVVKVHEISEFLMPLRIEKIPGIGPKTAERLHKLGVDKVGDLVKRSINELVERFGKSCGAWLHRISRGIHSGEVGSFRDRKSIGAERTFGRDSGDLREIYSRLNEINERIFSRVLEKKVKFKTVTVKVRYRGFETHTCQRTVKGTIGKLEEAKKITKELVRPFLASHKKIRLIGVRYSGFLR